MLRGMTSTQFQEWKAFDDLDPMGEERNDFRFASIVQALWNIARDQKRAPWPISDFLLYFGDMPGKAIGPVVQTVETQELLIDSWVSGHNAVLAAKEARRK